MCRYTEQEANREQESTGGGVRGVFTRQPLLDLRHLPDTQFNIITSRRSVRNVFARGEKSDRPSVKNRKIYTIKTQQSSYVGWLLPPKSLKTFGLEKKRKTPEPRDSFGSTGHSNGMRRLSLSKPGPEAPEETVRRATLKASPDSIVQNKGSPG